MKIQVYFYHDWSAFIGYVTGLDENHLECVEVVLRAVVEIVQLLLEIVQYLSMSCHVRGQDQNDHVLKLGGNSNIGRFILVLTPRMSLNSSSDRLEKILHSGELRILKETAQWWFSRGDISLYLIYLEYKKIQE